jgi:exodeoxyribonuclease VII large subunit
VVSGVGHEVDITIADFVADHRAATPTAAAEAVTPDQQAWMQTLDWYHGRLEQLVTEKLSRLGERLTWIRTRLTQQHPLTILQRLRQQVHDMDRRMRITLDYNIRSANDRMQHAQTRLLSHSPAVAIRNYRNRVDHLLQQVQYRIKSVLEQRSATLRTLASTLNAISPLQTLSRGYSITSDSEGQMITKADSVSPNALIKTRLHIGQLISRVEKIIKD